jgi:hypothetical protein
MPENLPVIATKYCHRLRCKEMYIDMGTVFNLEDSGSGIYWCSHTQNCMGPDGKVADLENCQAGRGCFEEV